MMDILQWIAILILAVCNYLNVRYIRILSEKLGTAFELISEGAKLMEELASKVNKGVKTYDIQR